MSGMKALSQTDLVGMIHAVRIAKDMYNSRAESGDPVDASLALRMQRLHAKLMAERDRRRAIGDLCSRETEVAS